MKYLAFLFLFCSVNVFAQNFSADIAKHREDYKRDFLKQSHSPLKETDLKYLQFYDADSTYKVMANVELLKNEKVFKMPSFSGSGSEYYRYAVLTFDLKGKKAKLSLYKNVSLSSNPAYKNYLFLPFTDETNSGETYGGGRYIDLNIADIRNNQIEIDFNKAYNPYCAYSNGYRCPVPPEENDLELAIKAGEKLFAGDKKH